MNRKRGSVVLPKGTPGLGGSLDPSTPPTSSPTSIPKGLSNLQTRVSSVTAIRSPLFDKPKPVVLPKNILANNPSPASPHFTGSYKEIENLQIKKRSVLGTITTGRRELEEVRNEIAKLKIKEADLVAVLEKRDQAVAQINQEIEALEQKDFNAEEKRKEAEKAQRIKDEIEKRRREEEHEERKKLEEEQDREKEKEREREREKERERPTPKPVYAPQFQDDEDENAEEIRLMRAMSRPGKGGTVNTNVASRVVATPPSKPKPQITEADRIRMAEDKKKIGRRTKIGSRETVTR